ALSGSVEIETQMGYLPFVQDNYLNTFVKKAFDKNEEITGLIDDRGGIAAAGDIGDLAFLFPCIQISYGGFTGAIHGDDFRMIDDRFVLEQFPRFVSQVFEEMNGHLDTSKFYKRNYKEYEQLIESIIK
ncbi:carboxypeptidase, partial [Listeria welshimeri]|nr:carboxypeptidase [Listeria welshimeri]